MTHLLPSSLLQDLDVDTSYFEEEFLLKDNDDSLSGSTTTSPSTNACNEIQDYLPKINPYILTGEFIRFLSKQKSTYTIQKLLGKSSTEEIDLIIKHLHGKMTMIMQDSYGNYFFNDLFRQANKQQRFIILSEISHYLIKIAMNQYGTHPIQTLIETTKDSYHKEHSLVNQIFLSNPQFIIDLCLNQHGTHVIQKMLCSVYYYQNVFNVILRNFLMLTLDLNGVCVIKCFMQIADLPMKQWILMQFNQYFKIIGNDVYGNYAIQHALKIWWNEPYMISLKGLIIMNYELIAMSKNASHIAEVFLNQMNYEERKVFIYDLLFKGKLKTISMCKYGYGVYVINHILRFIGGNERDFIIKTMQSQMIE